MGESRRSGGLINAIPPAEAPFTQFRSAHLPALSERGTVTHMVRLDYFEKLKDVNAGRQHGYSRCFLCVFESISPGAGYSGRGGESRDHGRSTFQHQRDGLFVRRTPPASNRPIQGRRCVAVDRKRGVTWPYGDHHPAIVRWHIGAVIGEERRRAPGPVVTKSVEPYADVPATRHARLATASTAERRALACSSLRWGIWRRPDRSASPLRWCRGSRVLSQRAGAHSCQGRRTTEQRHDRPCWPPRAHYRAARMRACPGLM